MEIKFSRHAKRRMQLYKIDEDDIRRTIESAKMSKGLQTGKHEEVNHDLKDTNKTISKDTSYAVFVILRLDRRIQNKRNWIPVFTGMTE
jgi:hypothetical protein